MEPENKPAIETNEGIVLKNRTDFFIDEFARIEADWSKQYVAMSNRIAKLEQKGKSTKDDPEKLFATVFIIVAVVQIVPLILDLVKDVCRSSPLQPSSL